MTDDLAGRTGAAGADRLRRETEAVMDTLVSQFRRTSDRHGARPELTLNDVTLAHAKLGSMCATIMDEVTRHEASILDTTHDGGSADLDLDAARSEIRRRLDRIRVAGA